MKEVFPFTSIEEGKAYDLLGWHMDRYEREELACLPPAKVMRSQPMLRRYPQFSELENGVYVPKIFSMHLPKRERNMTSGIRVCSRSLLTDREFVLNLKDLGFSDRDEYQAFREVAKGIGVRIGESRFTDVNGVRELAKRHGFYKEISEMGKNELGRESVISRGNHEFDAPEGGELGEDSGEAIRRSNMAITGKIKLKVTPLVCCGRLPKESQQYAAELSDSVNSKSPLYQEKLLFPSVLRMVYFESQPRDKLSELCLYISDSPEELEDARSRVFEDAVKFFETVPRNTFRYGREFLWDCPFDIWLAYNATGRVYNHSQMWFLAKDLLVSRTGAYYTDFEGWNINWDIGGKSEIKRRQHIHLTNTFKVFSRFLTLFEMGIEQVRGRPLSRAKAAKIERDTLGRLIDTINGSDFLNVSTSNNDLDVKAFYEYVGVGNGGFRIDKKYLFPMYQ